MNSAYAATAGLELSRAVLDPLNKIFDRFLFALINILHIAIMRNHYW